MRNFIILKKNDNTIPLKHYFGSIFTARGEAEFYCTYCRKYLDTWKEKRFEKYDDLVKKADTENCPRGDKEYIVLNSLNGLEHILNCGYTITNIIQDPIETDEY